jgi:HTH-type transcriptional regulator/antitoxin HigA
MELKILKSENEYQEALDWLDLKFDENHPPSSPVGEKIQIVLLLVKQYEDEHYYIPTPDPIEAIKLKMVEKGLRNKDFVGKIGSKGYVSAIINRHKPLTLETIRVFKKELNIPAELFI